MGIAENFRHRPATSASRARSELAGGISNEPDQRANEKLAFERGAVDFIDKARGMEILASRLRLLSGTDQRIPATQGDKPIVCGNLVLRPESGQAYWHGADVGLTVGEYKIAHLLASNAGSHVTYRAIYDR